MLKHRIPAVAIVAAFAAPALAQLGSLNPPPGPVSDTGPNLREIEPRTIVNETNTPPGGNFAFIITEPGHYVFDGNKSVESGRDGILIDAPDVVLDMNGFSLTTPLSIVFASGITIFPASDSNVTIRNGTIRNFGDGGIIVPDNSLVENVKVFNGFLTGITAGDNSKVRNCFVSRNTGSGTFHGILVGNDSRVEGCTVKTTQGSGITCGEQGQILGNTVIDTQAAGITVGESSRVVGNIVENIGTSGVIADVACSISDNTVRNTLAFGIRAGLSSRVVGNTLDEIGTTGIEAFQGSVISQNTVTDVGEMGIDAFSQVRILGNIVTRPGESCIRLRDSSIVSGNTLSQSGMFGIDGVDISTIDANLISDCGDGALNLTGDGNKITRNHVIFAGSSTGVPGGPGFYIQGNATDIANSFIGPANDLMSPWANVVD